MAFIIWDVGSRAPGQLLRDLRAGFSSRRTLAAGLWRFALGAVVILAGALLMLGVTVVDVRLEFTVLEAIAIVSGLSVEALVGSTIRTHISARGSH